MTLNSDLPATVHVDHGDVIPMRRVEEFPMGILPAGYDDTNVAVEIFRVAIEQARRAAR